MPAPTSKQTHLALLPPISLLLTLLLPILLLITAPIILAEHLPIKTYTTADGLARDYVARIVRDSKGFLWFCTGEGLSRFDGYRFTNYGIDQGMPSRIVNDLIETRDGVYWVATNNGLCRFDPEATPTGQRFPMDYQGEKTIGHEINVVLEDHNGVVWCGGLFGFYRLDRVRGQWICSSVSFNTGKKYPGGFEIRAMIEDRRGALWLTLNGDLCRRRPDGEMQLFGATEGVPTPVLAVLEDRDGQIWFGALTGLYQLVPEPRLNSPAVARIYTKQDGLTDNSISSLFQAADGRLWVGASGSGLNVSLPNSMKVSGGQGNQSVQNVQSGPRVLRFHGYTKANGLAGVGRMAEDRDGNLWVGTESNGAMKIAANGFTSYDENDGLLGMRIASLIFTETGELCSISGHNNHLTINRFNGQRFNAVQVGLPAGLTYWGWGWYQTIFHSRAGEWWMQTGQGVVRYPLLKRLEQLAIARPQAIYTKRDGLGDEQPFRIFEDSHSDVWIGTFSTTGGMLTRWERQTGVFHRFTTDDGVPQKGVPSAFAEDASGNLWIGLYEGGVMRYRGGRLTMFSAAAGVPGGIVRGIYLDQSRRLWVATGEGGAVRIDDPGAEQPHFIVYNTSNGLSSNQASCFTEDQWGRIYIGTGRGLDRLDPASGQIKHYTTADGLANSFVSVALRDGEGALWFGTLQGLSRLIPQPDPPSAPSPIMISELYAGGVLQPLSVLGATTVPELTLGPNQNQVRINFFGLNYEPGEVLRYQYKLENADKEWGAPTNQRLVNYANLAPGAYRFMVRAVTSNGTVSQTPATVSFKVLPAVWRRWWFLTLAGLAIVLGLIAFERYRAARLQEINSALTESRKLTQELTNQRGELRKTNHTLELEYEITRILAESATPAEAAPRTLQAICENLGWHVGAIWNVDEQTGSLHCVNVWQQRGTSALGFEALTRQSTFAPGEGLPGRVWQSGQAHWITDLESDPNFPRIAAAKKENLRSAFGFPILLRGQVIGVLEFFSRERHEADAEQIKMMSAIGSHIGQLIERKRAEQALRQSETRFRTLAETASDAIITIDKAGLIVFVNPATEKVFGYSAGSLIGQELTMLMPEYLRHLHHAGFTNYQKTGQRHIGWEAIELPGLHRNGHEIPLEISFGEFTSDGRRYFTGIARDISERKRAAEALQRSREERMVELERVRRRIATDLHDDIGSSLTQISILSEVVRQRLGNGSKAANEPLAMIAGASRELVDSMSDIVWAINPQKDHLRDLTQRMRRFAADSFTARNINFQLRLPEDEDIQMGANLRREVFLIFKESVNNMVKHSGCTEANIEMSIANGELNLRLSDNGRGFDLTRESDGHGLVSMLDRAKGIRGQFQIDSQPGAGTTIILTVELEESSLTGRFHDLAT